MIDTKLTLSLLNTNSEIEILENLLNYFKSENSILNIKTYSNSEDLISSSLNIKKIDNTLLNIVKNNTVTKLDNNFFLPIKLSHSVLFMILGDFDKECLVEVKELSEAVYKKNISNEVHKDLKLVKEKLSKVESDYMDRTNQMIYLLNHSSQGFLTFGVNLIIDDESSYECMNIFNTFVGSRYLPEILFPNDIEQQDFIKKLLIKILTEKNTKTRPVYKSLLPNQIKIDGKTIKCNFLTIFDFTDQRKNKFMLVLTDITKEIQHQKDIKQERDTLTMVVKSVVDYNDLMYTIKQYNLFVESLYKEIDFCHKNRNRFFSKLLRKIHTFKGNFAQLSMVNTAPFLHNLETKLSQDEELLLDYSLNQLKEYLEKIDFKKALNEDMESLENILSKSFFSQESKLIVYKDRLEELVKRVKSLLPQFEGKIIEDEIRKLARKPFSKNFYPLISYTHKIAEERGILIEQIYLDGGTFFIDLEYYSKFVKTLVHILRNSVYHGIEFPEERLEVGKDEFGNISISIKKNPDEIIVEIKDDGRGIDTNLLKKKALELSLYTVEELENMNKKELFDIMFVDRFTTSESVNDIAGRGVGMSAVKDELEEINGSYIVESELGKGTSFIFRLPIKNEKILDRKIHINEIMIPVVDTIRNYLKNELSIDILNSENFKLSSTNSLKLDRYTAILRLSGVIQGNFILSGDQEVVKDLAISYMGGEELYSDDEIELVLAEQLNIIIGNSIKKFPGIENLVDIDSPFMIQSDSTIIKYLDSNSYNYDINTSKGVLRISFVTSNYSDVLIGIEEE
ncbi:MAG: hypothetical protein CR982_09515 [Candidatus Cloacimonadota bacterium]|nr:MAG: hypothetical protein CR982_09515 [Candidatus Cloacimonadota bacterium]PIE79277.1 MAG: hypothetical protein CSA15_03690 [Candidatus Delongbacteria bacterium]